MKAAVGYLTRGLTFVFLAIIAPLGAASAAPPAGALHVVQLTPVAGSSGVRPNALVAVVFDRPVVPLARLGSGLPAATIAPAVPGQARWLGTSTYAIIPAHGLAPATRYTLHLNPALRAIDGTRLAARVAWSFTTLRPAVVQVAPGNSADEILPQTPIDLTFNVPVVHASAQARFALRRQGTHGPAIPGAFSWRGPLTMRFTPSALLPRGARLQVTESPGVQALGGPLAGTRSFSSGFAVAPAFTLSSSDPANGATTSDPYVSVNLTFTAPPDLRVANRYVSVSPALDALYIGAGDQDTLVVNGNFRPSTTYRVTVRAGLPSLLGDHLARTHTITFHTPAYQPALQIVGTGTLDTYDAYRGVRLFANVTNVKTVTFRVYRQSEGQFLTTNNPSFDRSGYTSEGLPLVARYTQAVNAPLNHTVTIAQRLTGPHGALLPPGYYVVFADAPGVDESWMPLLVTRSSLTFKVGDNSVLVWANDLKSGLPLANTPVRIVDQNGQPVLRGRTGPDGVYRGAVPPSIHLGYKTLRALLDRPGDVAACGTDWNGGIGPYDYNLPFDPTITPARVYLNTDRPIYRPGQTILFRGLARGDDDGRYRLLAAGTPVHVVATDAQNHTVLDRTLRLDDQGVFHGSLPLSGGAVLGPYSLQATIDGQSGSAYVTVAAYRKPTFRVDVLPDHGEDGSYAQGQQIKVTAHAAYYFGAPLAGAAVQWTVTSAATYFQPQGYDGYSFVDENLLYGPYQYQAPPDQQLIQISGKTDATGAATAQVPATVNGSPIPRAYTIEANVTGPAHEQVAQQSSVTVHPANVYVGLRPQQYLAAPGTPQGVDVVTVRPDGTPVSNMTVTLVLQRQRTYSVLQYVPGTGYIWQNETRNQAIRTFAVTTDASGHAVAHLSLPSAGGYRLAAHAHDALGNTAATATYLYSEAAGDNNGYIDWGLGNNDRIRLIADRQQYRIGDVARVLVAAPYTGMHALVTLERGTILSHRVITLRGNSPILSIPITNDTVPNVYVSVVLFRGSGASAARLPVWKMGYTTLVVDPRERALTVQVHPIGSDGRTLERARPGQRVRFAVHTQDSAGHPVAASVGLALVDAAVLALAANQNGTPTDVFYTQRPLGIATAASMALYVDRLNLSPGDGRKGGGAGGGGVGGTGAPLVRTKFPDTAYWNPEVRTNAAGNAAVSVTLPDNLTTWHMSAEGSTTRKTLLGDGSADLISTKPVLLEPALPRFLAVRDTGRIGGVVTNTTGRAVRLRVDATVAMSSASGNGTETLGAQVVTVPAHADRAVLWTYQPQAQGSARVTLSADAGVPGLSDALAQTLPIEQNTLISAEAAATAGDTPSASITETVRVPATAEPGEGGLYVALEPSLVAGLGPAESFLLSYPYDCAEQMTSRLTGMLALAALPPRDFGLDPRGTAALPGLIARTTGRLYAQQNSDGGWGWWPESPSDPYLSAYVFDGLLYLRENGYAVDRGVLSHAVSYLQGQLALPSGDPNAPDDATRAFILYALGQAGSPDGADAAALYERRRGLDAGSRASLALALAAAFGRRDPRVHTLIDELSAAARITSTEAHWETGNADTEVMETSSGDTALVLRMLLNLDPSSPLIPRAVRWLMDQRGAAGADNVYGDATSDGAWEDTQTTALALRALSLYALRAGDTHPRYAYRVLVNGATVAQGTVTPATAGQQRQAFVPIDALRAAGDNAVVRIVRAPLPGGPRVAGTPLHYTVRLRYYPNPESVVATDSGLSLSRRFLGANGAPLGGHAMAGSIVTVELRLVAPQDLSRVVIESPLPAGAEAVDGTLLTTSVFAQPGGPNNPRRPGYDWWYTPSAPGAPQDLGEWIGHSELRDDRVALFADYIPAGSYVYRYSIHLATAGTYHVLPAQASELYEPDVFGHTGQARFVVQ